jgi:hypothetical protein
MDAGAGGRWGQAGDTILSFEFWVSGFEFKNFADKKARN